MSHVLTGRKNDIIKLGKFVKIFKSDLLTWRAAKPVSSLCSQCRSQFRRSTGVTGQTKSPPKEVQLTLDLCEPEAERALCSFSSFPEFKCHSWQRSSRKGKGRRKWR